MKYELDTWYGWTGGECPVHPEDKVDVIFRTYMGREHKAAIEAAKDLNWDARGLAAIIAFRIVERHKEPEPTGLVWRKGEDGKEYCDTPGGRAVIKDHGRLGCWLVIDDEVGHAFYETCDAKSWLQDEINRKSREYANLSTDEQQEDDAGDAREFWAYRGCGEPWVLGNYKPSEEWEEVMRLREVK